MAIVASFASYELNPGTSSTFGSGFNVLCTVVGTGLLQLPYGGAQSGWFGAFFLTILCVMALYTAVVLIKCLALMEQISKSENKVSHDVQQEENDAEVALHSDAHAKAPPLSFGDIGEAAFGQLGKWAVIVQMHLTLTMVATIYNLLAGLNLVTVMGSVWPFLREENGENYAVLIIAGVVWFHVFLKTLSEVEIVSWLNMVITIAMEIIVICVALTSPPKDQAHTTALVTDMSSLGGAFASFAFAYGVHPILPTVYRNMKHPEKYNLMITAAFSAVAVAYLCMFFVGYGVYGDEVVTPIYNVPSMKDNAVVKVIVAFLTLHLLGAYAIVINPPERALESTLRVDRMKLALLWRILLRTGFVALTAVVSITVGIKNFGPFLDLVSSFTSSFTQFIFPVLFYLKLATKAGVKVSIVEWAWNGLILVVAVIGSTYGTINAVKELKSVF